MARDPYYGSVTASLHYNGADESTTFTDSSIFIRTVTANGGAQLTTGTKQFGTAGGDFTGTNAYLTIPGGTHFDLLGNDFTIEHWLNVPTSPNTGATFARTSSSGNASRYATFLTSGGKLEFFADGFSTVTAVVSTTTDLRDDTWHHVAFTRCGNLWSAWVDGVQEDSRTLDFTFTASNNNLFIGADAQSTTSRDPNIYMDDFRFTPGVCRYIATFAPPTEAFPDQGGVSVALVWIGLGGPVINRSRLLLDKAEAALSGTRRQRQIKSLVRSRRRR